MAERPLYTLYKNLKAQNYDVPDDYNKFESALTRDGKGGADNRHAIYENLKAQNFDVPSTYERFYSALFEPRSKTSSRAKGGSVPMSAADRARFSAGAAAISASAQQTMNNAGRYNRLKQRKQKQQKDFGRVNLGTHQTPYGGDANNVVKDDFTYNPETGKTGAYVTSDSETAYTQNDAEQKQNLLDKYGEEWNNAVDMGIVPSELDKADTELSDTDVAMRQMERRQEWLNENQNRRSKELNESMHLQGSPFVASGGAVAPSSFNTAISNEANRLSDVEYGAYNTAKAYNQMLRTTLLQELKEQRQRNENAGWWKDKWNDVSNYFGAFFNTMLDPKLYSQGVMDAAISNNLLQVKKGMEDGTIKKGSNAGNAAQAMLGAIQQQQGEAAKQQQYGSKAYYYGDMSGRSLKFMADFALSGWRNVMTTGFTKAGEKVGEKMALGALGKWFTKNTGRVLGDIAGSAALAATNQLGSTYNNVIERYVGINNENGGVTQDKNGDLKFNEGVSLGKAIKDGFGSATIENFSEMFGEYLPGAPKLLSKLGLSKVSSFFEKIGNNAYYKWLSNAINKSGIQGVMAEISEEEFGTALHAAWGDGDGSWSDFNVFTNPDAREKQIDTCLGMFYSVGFMQAPRTAVGAINAVQYFNIKHQVAKADKFGQMMFNDKWEDIKSKIDVTTNADLTKTVLDATRSDSMTAKQKGAVINYAMFLSKLRGFNQAADAKTKDKVEEGDTAPTLSNDLDDAYTEGHNSDDTDKHNIQLEQNDKANELAAMLNITPEQLHDMADEDLEAMTGQDDKLDQAIYDYQVSTAKYQGVMDGAQDEVDMAAHQAAMETDNMTDLSRGTVRKATIKATGGLEDYEVYIISGNIATHDDGSIDVGNSDDMIIYYDPTTGRKEHADAMMFADLIEELPAADVKAQAIIDAKENAIKNIAGIIDGTVEVGSQFSVTDADGTEHTYEVLADNGDGTAMITIDGNIPTELVKGENVQIPYSFADLQQMKDAEDLKRLEAAKAQREQMEKERAAQQNQNTEETQPSFDFNQILNDNGNVVLADVLGKDGNTKYPNSQLFLIRDSGAKAKVMELTSDGSLIPHAVNKKDVRTATTMTLDEYKQAFATTSMIEDNSGENRGEIEVEAPTIEGEVAAPVNEVAAPESAETPATEQTPAAPAMTLEDGTIVPMLEDGNPDFSKLTAAQTAELYDTQFGEDADSIVSGYVSDAKKALDKASNMTVKGKTFVEQKAAKDAKEKAIADAQAAYDSAIAIRDAYNERQLAKVEDTAEGRKELIEKARRKFARLKSAVKDDAEAVSQLYRETIGSLLHRLYDGTGIDVTDTTPLTAEEYVASNLGAHSLNYEGTETSKGVKQETGLSREDFAKTQLLAADGKGTTIDALVHSLWENLPSNLESLDTQDIRNALIGVLNSGFKASEARNFVENIRIAQAENILEEQKRAQENAAYAEQHKAEPEAELKAKSDEKAELKAKSEAKLDNESDNESNDLSNETDNEQKNDNINDNINVPEDATDEAPLGAQRDESDLPFSAKENGKQQTTAERAADVEKNKVDDMKVVDNIVGEKTRKTLEKLAKMMGANVQWQYSDKNANGWFDDKTNTIYLTLDSSITEGVQFIFGHEMTHEMRTKNPAAYDELKTLVKDMMGEDAFNKETDRITSLYNENNVFYNGGRTAYEEEVVADQLGSWIRDANYAHTLLLKMSHPLLARLHEIVNRFLMALHGTEFSDDMNLILRSIEQAYVKTANGQVTNSETGEDVSFSLRQKPEPKKKGIGYKVFVLKDGKLYPPMVANPDGAATPVGVWLDADAAPIAGESKTGRPQVKQGGKGTQGGSGKLAYRPGWHLGVVPYAIQFNRKDAEGNKTLFPKNFVFAEVEYAADVDYQEEARQEGINPSGKYQHSLAGLKHLPTDGYYMYRTNPNPETDPWVITGAMKVNRILTRAEQAELVKNAGREPQQIQEGDIVTDDVVNSINQEIADAPKFSLKDNQENPLNQDGTLKLDKIKSVDELTDEDFTSAFRNVELPAIPKNVDAAIGANGKPVVIKKNIFEKNWNAHKFTPAESKKVLNDALYNTDLVGHTQPTKKPNHWVAIKLDDKSPITVLEVNDNKDNVEVVGWYTLDERNLGRIKRQAERNGGELIMLTPKDDKVESLSTPPLSSAAKIDNSSETAKENGEKFSLKDEKTLVGVHNISEEKLLKAIKQGGLANPSVAVIDSSRQDHKAYGGISLIMPSDKIAKRTGKNAGTWQGDAYTPTYPQVERQMSNKGAEKASKDVSSVPSDMYSEVRRELDRWLDGGEANSAMAYMFLHEKGVVSEPKKIQPKFSDEAYNELKFITAGDFNIYGIGKADAQKVLDMYIEAKFDGDKDLYEEKTKAWLERNKSIVDAGANGGMRYAIAKENVELYDEYGFNYKGVQSFVRDVEYDHRKTGVDTDATLNEVENYIKTNNLTDEFNTWLEGKEKEYGIKEVIFDGFTPSGNRRYVPNTLENVSKIMKKQGRNGATGAAVSFQNFAARLMPSYGTLNDIRSKRDLLTSDREKFDKFREKWSNVFFELGMKCQPDATGTFADYGLARLSEAAMTSDPQAYLKKEYNVDFSDEDTKRLKEMVKAIKEEHPAMYFETKFERPVSFDEFSAAVVPTTTKKEVKDVLKNAGVSIFEYDEKSDADRSRAFNEAINSSDNIRFSLAGVRGAAAADKAEERNARMDNLSVARKMEEEKKDAKAIKMATGWERGADGKWRYEMPDAKIKDTMDVGGGHIVKRYEDDMLWNGGKLFDVIDAPELFKAYPQLKGVRIDTDAIMNDMPSHGEYDSKTNTITIHADELKYMNDILNHEIQHAIQGIEGFATGGSPTTIRGEVKKRFNEVTKQIKQLRAEGKEDEAKALIEKNRGLYDAYMKNDDFNSYKSLAGEVEARNVQERMNMTPEERRKTLAESTEDVARKDQIFLGVGDVSFSLRDMSDGKESGAADMAEDLKSLNTPDEVDDAIKTAIEDMPSGWKMANKKMIHIAQALGENRKAEIAGEEPKFSLKDGTLIKAGTYFSGGGLVEEGLKGIIDPVVAVEYDEKISGVYRNNFGQHIVTADVRDVDPKELVKQIDGEVEYFHASPVCKNYSQAKSNHAEVELDKETAASTAEFINAIKPKVVTIENVKGYKDSEAMKTITDALDANGYTWDADVYNAADYGGYTNRERLIVRAVRDGKLPAKPEKMARKSGWYEAVADIIPTLTEKKNGVAPWMDIRLKADGIDWRNIDKPLYVMGSAYADGKVPHAFADELLPTLRTKSGDVIVMPDGKVYRAMGRVLARVSGVSDDYKMPFSENLSHIIIGNGIPTQLTEHVIAPLLTGSDPKFSIRTYHGTGASFDKFDFSHMGEGEGSQAFGWGGYVTNSKDIAEDYTRRAKIRKDNGGFEFVTDMSANNKDMVRQYIYKYKDVNKGLDAMRKDLSSALEMFPDDDDLKELSNILAKKNEEIAVPDNIAYLYDVDIPDDNGDYLDWDAPLTDKQKNTIIKELRRLKIDFADFKKRGFSFDGSFGGNAYDFLMYALRKTKKWKDVNASRAVSKFLSSIGFTGIKYKAGTIFGGAKEGDYNYVIFDENNANIVGNTRFSLRYDQFEHDLNQWKKDNNLPKDAQRPTIPQRNAGESAVDFLRRVDEYRKQMALWKTAPTYEQHLLSDDTALGEFNRELQKGSVLKRIAFQDSMLAIRKAQEAIMKEVGVDRLNMAEDAYTAENRSHGKGKNEFEEYNNEFLQPLRKAYHQMKKILGDSYDNVRIYMVAKHGLERNAQMAFKKSLDADFDDVAKRSAAYRAYKGDMNRIINDSDLEYGRIDFKTWRNRDNLLRTKYSPSYMAYRYDENGIVFDYSGLSALFGGPDFEEAGHKLVRDIEDKYVTETHDLWDATNAATKKILRDGYKAGMMSKDTYQYVRDMYGHYIPLRGWDGTTADQVWDYVGGGKGSFNQTLKTAHGRTSIADDPIAYIENMAESGILLNNKNWVKQHLMLLAQNHPTSLLTLSKAWYVKSTDANGNEEWIPATPQITSQMNSNQVKATIDAFEKKMEQMAVTGDATQKRDGLNIAYPQTHSEEREHEVRVMKDGEEYVIYVNGDPQLAQAMNNTRAHRVREIQSGKLDRAAAWLGRKMAAAYTSLSPLFIPSNYFRDLTMTLASTAIREDGRYNYLLRKNMATSWNLGFMLRDYQNGKLREKVSNGNATAKEQMFYDFMMNGGETGFVSSLDVEDLKKKFKNDLKDLDRWKANPVKVRHTIMDGIEFLNRMIEDSNRFAVYMTSIQYGRSIDEAVNDAKDVTLNFNRKGTGEYGWQMIRNLYLFINPAVQSLQTLGALAKHHPFKFTAVTASWLASGVLVPIVNVALMSMLGGDDDKDKYWQFTKWDRRNNLIMWVPYTHEYVKIPLAQEFRAFYGIGDMIASKMMGGELAEESWSQYAEDLLGQVVDMLPLDPTGYDGNIAVSLMPNAIRPVFELAFNVDFTGKPLFKETEYNKYDPNFTKAYVGTPDWLVRASRMVNSIGNDYPDVQQNSIDAFGDPRYNLNNPAVVDHVLSSYLGGAYTMGSQVLGLLTKSLNDPKEIKVADIPLFSKFVSNPDDRPVTKKQGDEFWNMKENHDRAANTLSKLKKQAKVDGDYSMLERFYGSEEYKKYKQDDVKVKKYEEDKKKERAEESGEEYRPYKLNAEDIYKAHATPKDDFEDLKLKQLYTKLNGFKTSYDLLVDTAPSQSDGYYNNNKAAIDAIDEISLDKQEISELKKGFLDDGKDAYNAEDMKQIRDLRKKILSVLEKANKVVVANQKAKAKK